MFDGPEHQVSQSIQSRQEEYLECKSTLFNNMQAKSLYLKCPVTEENAPSRRLIRAIAREDEIWQKINPVAFHLVLRDQSGWVWLGFLFDYDQFGTTYQTLNSNGTKNFAHLVISSCDLTRSLNREEDESDEYLLLPEKKTSIPFPEMKMISEIDDENLCF
ncbi:hypothetical protein HGM15179_017941 [Zosterops borbonicus]|uniref:Uncharacterized protein n=1 Tax=Zosterops borbonicus TaxID=364589 RepID=A0A8K1LCT4_9PASS|nr:hypothetical protein HGM15179_017941 [Zosterops borbonicus]